MPNVMISIGADAASDSWGFVGVVRIGDVEAYRTLEAFATPADAEQAMQQLVAEWVGGMLAAQEWHVVKEKSGAIPTRFDFKLGVLNPARDQTGLRS